MRSRHAHSQPAAPSNGIRGAVKHRLVHDMFEAVTGQFKVLIVDTTATLILNAACRMHELMDHGVTLVEDIKNKRQPLPTTAALYFVAPTAHNVQMIVNDWATKAMYSEAHIFFTSTAPETLIQQFSGTNAANYIKTLKDLLLDFSAAETLCFSFEMKYDLSGLFGRAPPNRRGILDQAAAHMVSLLQTLGESDPMIRYQNTDQAKAVALSVQHMTGIVSKSMTGTASVLAGEQPATVLIVDRSLDIPSALLHELTYQAMLHDLSPLENGIYTQHFKDRSGKETSRAAAIDEEDAVWCKYRHVHISELLSGASKEMNALLSDNPDLAGGMNRGAKLTELGEAVRQLPKFQERQAKLSLHMDIADKLYKAFEVKNLRDVCDLEQRMATGENSDGTKVGFKDLYKDAVVLMKGPLPREVKQRLLLLLVSTCGSQLSRDKREELLQVGRLDSDINHQVDVLEYFNVATTKHKDKGSRKKVARGGAKDNDAYELSRYEPRLKSVVDSLLRDSLSENEFPHTRTPTHQKSGVGSAAAGAQRSLRSGAAPKFSSTITGSSRSGEKVLDLGHDHKVTLSSSTRILVCVLGGMTYGEARSMYELVEEHHREILFGGTNLISPEQFLQQLPLIE